MNKIIKKQNHPIYGEVTKFRINGKNENELEVWGYIDAKDASLRMPGYIITKEGELIMVPESVTHSHFFSEFLRLYRGEKELVPYDTFTGAVELAKEGFLVYIGIRDKDIYYDGLQGDTGFFVPDERTEIQHKSHKELISHKDDIEHIIRRLNVKFNYINTKGELFECKPFQVDEIVIPKEKRK